MGVFPVFVTGLHCGELPIAYDQATLLVFPVFVTGLHCGSAAFLHARDVSLGLPGLHDRAPLRHLDPGENARLERVFPVFMTGIHYGTSTPANPS